ncbi:hypothetical protein MSAN_02444200 [Mycena sanguinolenta]|uniref:Uncharacterized protein n=1 Tax=Mycena sanguinolenta TaxID=230812 RepID=A0A8H6WYU4_9AGAR|nr:hypothetical protein MSAN_02444200 [Mycena sanguinolenta]
MEVAATGFNTARDYVYYEPATEEDNEACRKGKATPIASSKFYFGPGFRNSPWNEKILKLHARQAQTMRVNDPQRWGVPDVKENYIISILRTIVKNYQEDWRRHQRRPNETEEEFQARVEEYEEQRQDKTSKTSRKKSKRETRMATVVKMIKISLVKERKDGDRNVAINRAKVEAWEFLQELLKRLPTQAMSSEEVSDRALRVEGVLTIVKVHKILICPWRHEKIAKYMEWVDETGRRMKTNEQWLEEERAYDDDLDNTLHISGEVFKLLKLASKSFERDDDEAGGSDDGDDEEAQQTNGGGGDDDDDDDDEAQQTNGEAQPPNDQMEEDDIR